MDLRYRCSFSQLLDYQEAMSVHYNFEEANYHDTKPKLEDN